MGPKMDRRELLKSCGVGILTFSLPAWRAAVLEAQAPSGIPQIKVGNNYGKGQWFFDPAGIFIPTGSKLRVLGDKWGATFTAFHPSNYNHELRIPENAKPFDSGVMGEDSDKYSVFEWTFDVEGTYDFFSRNHEVLGMVGRIVVGAPGGPAEKNPPGYGAREGRAPVFPAQAKLLNALSSQQIVAKKTIPYPRDLVVRSYPYGDTR